MPQKSDAQVESADDAERESAHRRELARAAGKTAVLGPGTRIRWTKAISGEKELN